MDDHIRKRINNICLFLKTTPKIENPNELLIREKKKLHDNLMELDYTRKSYGAEHLKMIALFNKNKSNKRFPHYGIIEDSINQPLYKEKDLVMLNK